MEVAIPAWKRCDLDAVPRTDRDQFSMIAAASSADDRVLQEIGRGETPNRPGRLFPPFPEERALERRLGGNAHLERARAPADPRRALTLRLDFSRRAVQLDQEDGGSSFG